MLKLNRSKLRPVTILQFAQKIIQWYSENKRDFKWRSTRDPYRIWLSEIILQQTRAAQGLPYYERFIETFPDIHALANAPEDAVLKLWQGLGYYSRARNLHATALYISRQCEGQFPESFEDLLQLKGVGDYTASAIASICFNQPQAVVDGNVFRFLARYFGMETPIDTTSAHNVFKGKATDLMDLSKPGLFNQAMMEFGALQCTPKAPRCSSCPFQTNCIAHSLNKQLQFPVKNKKTKVINRYFNYLVLVDRDENICIQQRDTKGIWQKLYEFPLLETDADINSATALFKLSQGQIKLNADPKKVVKWTAKPILHKLSHQNIRIQFWVFPKGEVFLPTVPLKILKQYAVPVVIQNFIEDYFNLNG